MAIDTLRAPLWTKKKLQRRNAIVSRRVIFWKYFPWSPSRVFHLKQRPTWTKKYCSQSCWQLLHCGVSLWSTITVIFHPFWEIFITSAPSYHRFETISCKLAARRLFSPLTPPFERQFWGKFDANDQNVVAKAIGAHKHLHKQRVPKEPFHSCSSYTLQHIAVFVQIAKVIFLEHLHIAGHLWLPKEPFPYQFTVSGLQCATNCYNV